MNPTQLLATCCLLATTASAQAVVVIDQSHVPDNVSAMNSSASISWDTFRRAQTFTVGVSGFLNSVQVFTTGTKDTFDNMNILDRVEGTGNIISTSQLVDKTWSTVTFDFRPYNIAVKAGDVLAFEIFGKSEGDMQVVEYYGVNNSAWNDSYTGGSDFFINPDFGYTTFTPNPIDAYFVSTVDNGVPAVPEPSHYAMLALGLLCVGALASRRRA
ncbi:PEP-CTERM sorting domain-containing protein [Massilia violaceinigra]|nr:PEP-CTERM sorting domain-containing protein [Massilia violaceinigra]